MLRPLKALAILVVGAALSGLSFEDGRTRLRRELNEGLLEERVLAVGELRALDAEDAAPLIELALHDPEIQVRALAVEAAITLRHRAVLDYTRTLFASEDPEERRLASRAEGELGDVESMVPLTRALSDARALVRQAAAVALGTLRLSECAVPLGNALDDADTTVRVSAATNLGFIPGARATDFLLARSLDRTSEVRAAVIHALAERAEQEPERILPVLAASLEDESEAVRMGATLGLGRARSDRGLDTLIARITPFGPSAPEATRAREPHEALAALAALGRIDADRARLTLVRAERFPSLSSTAREGLRNQDAQHMDAVSEAIAEALQASPEHVDSLARLLLDMPHVHPALAAALLDISLRSQGDAAHVLPALAACTPSDDPLTESVVVHLLARLCDAPSRAGAMRAITMLAERHVLSEAAREALITHVQSESEDEGALALRALAALSPPPIDALLAQESEQSRAVILQALTATGDARIVDLALRAIQSPDPNARRLALHYFRAHPNAPAMNALVPLVEQRVSVDRFSLIEAIAMLAAGATESALEPRVMDMLTQALASSDPRMVSAAAAGLASVENTSTSRVIFMQAARSDDTSTALLRARASVDEGGHRAWLGMPAPSDAHAFAFDESLSFPVSITRAFVALQLARAGALQASDVPLLCTLATRREPMVRANAALALSAMHARCENIDPLLWVTHGTAAEVQLAGLAWLASSPTPNDARSTRVLSSCADAALDARVAARCQAMLQATDGSDAEPVSAASVDSTWLDITALDARGRARTDQWVALEFADGASLAARADGAGRIAMRVPALALTRISDPFASVLEP